MSIAIVYGGTSTERAASTLNANGILEALTRLKYDARMLPYDETLPLRLREEAVDMVYLCVQGKGHGDGTLQAVLDFMHIPYTGSGMTAAALINDKILCKALFSFYGHQTPAWTTLSRKDFLSGRIDTSPVGYPFVAKAPSQGGSFGIAMIESEKELDKLAPIFRYDSTLLLERFVNGTFYTVGVLEKDGELTALPLVEGVDKREGRERLTLFTGQYEAAPARLPERVQDALRQDALAIFRETGARDYARVDYMVDESLSRLGVLEINAVPGLKPCSLLPRAAAYAGIAYDDLINGILQNAIRRAKACSAT